MNFKSFVFTIQNVVSGYTLCHLENLFFYLYVSLKSFHGGACSITDKFRGSRSQMFFNIGVLKNFVNFTGNL